MYVFSHTLFSLFALLNILYFIYILIHLISWIRLPICAISNTLASKTKISVLIPSRNEEATAGNCINAIATQNYPAYLLEIIVADDHSNDRTKEVAQRTLSEIKISGKIISNRENVHGKKNVLTEAIKNSLGELIVITDADCESENKWLSTMEAEYQKSGAYMLCGPVQINNATGFLGLFQSLELCGLSLLSGAGINIGVPLLCNGANMAYTYNIFTDLEGFKGIDANPSGDDILLMFKLHKKYPGKISFVKSKDATVSTSSQASLKAFLSQRIRWASKGLNSKNTTNSFISMLVFSVNFLSAIAILFILVREKISFMLMVGLAAKIMADFSLLLLATHFFGKKKLLWIFPFAELFTMLYISWVGIVANFSSYTWKGREYKHPV